MAQASIRGGVLAAVRHTTDPSRRDMNDHSSFPPQPCLEALRRLPVGLAPHRPVERDVEWHEVVLLDRRRALYGDVAEWRPFIEDSDRCPGVAAQRFCL